MNNDQVEECIQELLALTSSNGGGGHRWTTSNRWGIPSEGKTVRYIEAVISNEMDPSNSMLVRTYVDGDAIVVTVEEAISRSQVGFLAGSMVVGLVALGLMMVFC